MSTPASIERVANVKLNLFKTYTDKVSSSAFLPDVALGVNNKLVVVRSFRELIVQVYAQLKLGEPPPEDGDIIAALEALGLKSNVVDPLSTQPKKYIDPTLETNLNLGAVVNASVQETKGILTESVIYICHCERCNGSYFVSLYRKRISS